MNAGTTIAGAARPHNRAGMIGPKRPLTLAPGVATAVVVLCSILAGCKATGTSSTEMPVWQLAYAEPVQPRLIARARIRPDQSLPVHLVQPLCDEFALVTIADPEDWADVRRRLGLEPVSPAPDLSRGMIVGILANVGEPPGDTWPIQIEAIRTRSGAGSLQARFAPGFYYPLRTAAYLELAYVPGLHAVRRVEISPGPRSFIIMPQTAIHSPAAARD